MKPRLLRYRESPCEAQNELSNGHLWGLTPILSNVSEITEEHLKRSLDAITDKFASFIEQTFERLFSSPKIDTHYVGGEFPKFCTP